MGGKGGADTKLRQDFVFCAVHPAELCGGFIVEAGQVQHAVEGVEEQLVGEGDFALGGLPSGLWGADDDFGVDDAAAAVGVKGEAEDVGGAVDAHELLMEEAHASVADDGERQFAEGGVCERAGQGEVFAEEGHKGFAGRCGDGQIENLGRVL